MDRANYIYIKGCSRKEEMFYLTTYATHFISYVGVSLMAQNYRDRKGTHYHHSVDDSFNGQQGIFYVHYPIVKIIHTMVFGIPVVKYLLECEKNPTT